MYKRKNVTSMLTEAATRRKADLLTRTNQLEMTLTVDLTRERPDVKI